MTTLKSVEIQGYKNTELSLFHTTRSGVQVFRGITTKAKGKKEQSVYVYVFDGLVTGVKVVSGLSNLSIALGFCDFKIETPTENTPTKVEFKRVVANIHTGVIAVWYKVNSAFIGTLKDKKIICRNESFRKIEGDIISVWFDDGTVLQGDFYIEFTSEKTQQTLF